MARASELRPNRRINGVFEDMGYTGGRCHDERNVRIFQSPCCIWPICPSSVCGDLGCAKGLSGLDRKYTEKIDCGPKFSYTVRREVI